MAIRPMMSRQSITLFGNFTTESVSFLSTRGAPICGAGLAMHRDGKFTENGKTRQKYCCPYKRTAHLHDCPCAHKCFHKERKATGCTKYVTIPNDYRLSIQRDTLKFKSVFVLRTECERYNSRFKATAQERPLPTFLC